MKDLNWGVIVLGKNVFSEPREDHISLSWGGREKGSRLGFSVKGKKKGNGGSAPKFCEVWPRKASKL